MSEKEYKLGSDIPMPEGVTSNQVSDGFHTFKELYDHRICLFLALMSLANKQGMGCGWSRRHDDGELCFGGGWVIGWIIMPNGQEVRYHMEDSRPLPTHLEREVGAPWNGKGETIEALLSIL